MVTADTLRDRLTPGAILDLTGEEVPHPGRVTILSGLENVTIRGGLWRAPLRIIKSKGVTVLGARWEGVEPRDRSALSIYDSSSVIVRGLAVEGWQSGMSMNGVSDFVIKDCVFSDMKADGIQAAAVWRGAIRGITVHGRRSEGKEHADAIQLRSDPAKPPTSDIIVEDIDATGNIAGFRCTQAGGRLERITVQRLRARVSTRGGATFAGVDGLTLADIDVGTLPGSAYQARITIDKACTNVVWTGKGGAAAYLASKPQAFTASPST